MGGEEKMKDKKKEKKIKIISINIGKKKMKKHIGRNTGERRKSNEEK